MWLLGSFLKCDRAYRFREDLDDNVPNSGRNGVALGLRVGMFRLRQSFSDLFSMPVLLYNYNMLTIFTDASEYRLIFSECHMARGAHGFFQSFGAFCKLVFAIS